MSRPHHRVILLPGDGIGPEVVAEARQCVDLFDLPIWWEDYDFGGVAIDRHGAPLPPGTLAACHKADAILLGAIGGDQWASAERTPEDGLLALRKALDLYANLRPARVIGGLEALSPLRADIASGADILVVRELTGGLYFGDKMLADDHASDMCSYSRAEIERVAHVAFRAARSRRCQVTSVDKANVLATSKLWRRVVSEVAAIYPDVTLNHLYVDAAAMALIHAPRRFDVILTENLFGDILSDELSMIPGSIGLLGSSSLGTSRAALFEPVHGSAPDIAGQDRANPIGAIESAAMMLDHLGFGAHAGRLRDAVRGALMSGCRTADLGGDARCSEFGAAVRAHISQKERLAV